VIVRGSQTGHLSGTFEQKYIKTFDSVFCILLLGFQRQFYIFSSLHASEQPQSYSVHLEILHSKPTRSGYERKNDSPPVRSYVSRD
jgi:hypothetical protein